MTKLPQDVEEAVIVNGYESAGTQSEKIPLRAIRKITSDDLNAAGDFMISRPAEWSRHQRSLIVSCPLCAIPAAYPAAKIEKGIIIEKKRTLWQKIRALFAPQKTEPIPELTVAGTLVCAYNKKHQFTITDSNIRII